MRTESLEAFVVASARFCVRRHVWRIVCSLIIFPYGERPMENASHHIIDGVVEPQSHIAINNSLSLQPLAQSVNTFKVSFRMRMDIISISISIDVTRDGSVQLHHPRDGWSLEYCTFLRLGFVHVMLARDKKKFEWISHGLSVCVLCMCAFCVCFHSKMSLSFFYPDKISQPDETWLVCLFELFHQYYVTMNKSVTQKNSTKYAIPIWLCNFLQSVLGKWMRCHRIMMMFE